MKKIPAKVESVFAHRADPSAVRILVVDDDKSVLRMIERLLTSGGYPCRTAIDAETARQCMDEETFALILCDVNMPGESGLDLVRMIATRHPETAAIMVSGVDNPEIAREALEIGAYGYIIKPFRPSELMINIENALHRRELEIQTRRHRAELERLVQERTEKLCKAIRRLRTTMEGAIGAMAMTVETRDPYTAGHQRRVARLAEAIAREAGLTREQTEPIRVAGIVHDTGKIAIPAEILSKPSALNSIEFELIKTHSRVGCEILEKIEFPWPIAQIVLQHHERMDGSGYPAGLSGDDVMPEARILAVADVVEAMASHRPYRPAMGIDAALEEIGLHRGTLYDPAAVDACIRLFSDGGYRIDET